ncbi:MAG: LysM peptidoglycan-binding domain-containing protein, partial [Actinomycetota bacterium]|nr:LysM peptidoglycan-binding domain-containing protein [Actinomycetota bacterium]
ADPVATTPVAGSAAASVVVTTGDSFWSIADEVLSSRLGRPSSDAETDGYWRALMERNADRLVVPGNFDLIYPGQVLALPDGDPTGGPPRLAETL